MARFKQNRIRHNRAWKRLQARYCNSLDREFQRRYLELRSASEMWASVTVSPDFIKHGYENPCVAFFDLVSNRLEEIRTGIHLYGKV